MTAPLVQPHDIYERHIGVSRYMEEKLNVTKYRYQQLQVPLNGGSFRLDVKRNYMNKM